VHLSIGGFDTHDRQRPLHDELLAQVDAGIESFWATLAPGFRTRTAVMIYSEFGRPLEPNGSAGTDHGTAGLMMMIGPRVNGGLHGAQPSLTNLDDRGNLRHQLDFRGVYATVLDDWLDADDREILDVRYDQLDLFRAAPTGGTGGGGGGGGGGVTFSDVPAGTWYSTAVSWLAAAGITTGTAPGVFSPDDPVTRGQMATFLWRYRGEPGGSPQAPFGDVARDRYYTAAVDWLFAQNITTGTAPNRFSPDDTVTRGQMATFLWRLEGSPAGSPRAGFSDVPAGRYYSDAVDWLLRRGITTGTGGNRYSPDDPVTRAQMATFLWRLAGEPAP